MDYVFKGDLWFPDTRADFPSSTIGSPDFVFFNIRTPNFIALRFIAEDPMITIGDLSDDPALTLQNVQFPEEVFDVNAFDIMLVLPIDGSEPTVTAYISDYAAFPRGGFPGFVLSLQGPVLTSERLADDDFVADLEFLSFSDGESVFGAPWGEGEPFDLRDAVGWEFLGQSETRLLPGTDAERAARVEDIALLYEPGLDRDGAIDEAGLNFWVDAVADGLSFRQLAGEFLDADEFQEAAEAFLDDGTDITDETVRDAAVFSDLDFVSFLYGNVLDREPDQPGLDFWLARLGEIAAEPTAREQMLIAFARSLENSDGTPAVAALEETLPGIWEFA